MNDSSLAFQEVMPEGYKPSGILNEMYDHQFTDINGRNMFEQIPIDMTTQQSMSIVDRNTEMIDNHFEVMRAKNMMTQQPYPYMSTQDKLQMQMANYSQNYAQPYGSFQQPAYGMFSNTIFTCPTVRTAPVIDYDAFYSQNQFGGGAFRPGYYGQFTQMQPPIINDKPAFKPSVGYVGQTIGGCNPTIDNILEDAIGDDFSGFMKPAEIQQQVSNNIFQQQHQMFGSPYSRSFPNSIFNGYQANPYFISSYQMKSATEMQEEAKNRFSIMKKLCNYSADGTGREHLSDEELVKILTPKQTEQATYQPDYTPKIHVVLMEGDEIICDPYGANMDKPIPIADEKVSYYNAIRYTNSIPGNMLCEMALQNHNKMYDAHKAKYPDSYGIVQFLNNAGGIYSDMLVRESVKRNRRAAIDPIQKSMFDRDINKVKAERGIYDQPMFGFGGLRNMSGQFVGQFNTDQEYTAYTGISLNPNGGLDIQLPDRLREKRLQDNTNYEQRREAFKAAIFNEKCMASPERRGE